VRRVIVGSASVTSAISAVENSVNEKPAHFLKHLVEFRRRHFSNGVENDVLFDGEKSLGTNEAWLIDLAPFTIAVIQRDSESVPMCAARDLTQNQIRAWKISNDQSGPPRFAAAISARKRNDNDFACYRFDHAASSSGEFQSRPRTDSLSSAPLNGSSRVCSGDSLPIDSRVLINKFSHILPRRTRSTLRKSLIQAP